MQKYLKPNYIATIASLLLLLNNNSKAQSITKIEPPDWWVGMQNDTVQLMVYGKDLKDMQFTFQYEGIKILKVENKEDNYAFINLYIPKDAKPNIIFIKADKGKYHSAISYKLHANDHYQPKGFNNADLVYLIMPDRFSNGNTQNDNVKEMEQSNRNHPGGRHGGDLQGIANHLDYIHSLGATTVWLTPFQEMNDDRYSYHGYGTSNYFEADARYTSGKKGSEENNKQYKDFTEACHQKNLKVVMDVVTNHIGNKHEWQTHYPRIKNWVHDSIINQFDMPSLTDPYATIADQTNMEKGWFVPSMPDLNQSNPRVAKYLIQNHIWWIKYAHIDGLRLDTEPFSEKHFLTQWASALQKEFPTLSIVGEVWSAHNQPPIGNYWQQSTTNKDGYSSQIEHIMDIPLWENATQAFKNNDAQKLYYTLSQDFVYEHPEKNFGILGNHDMERFFTTVDSNVAKYKLGIIFLATTNRIPQLYYGDEFGMTGKKNKDDGYVRADMPGGWDGDAKNIFNGNGFAESDKEMGLLRFNQEIWNWRKKQAVIHNGSMKHFYPKQGVYIYQRSLNNQKVIVVLNLKNEKIIINQIDYAEILKGLTANNVQFISENTTVNATTIDLPAYGYIILQSN